MIPIIILSSSAGTLGLMSSNNSQAFVSNNINVLSLLVGVFGLFSAMLSAIHSFLGIQKLQSTHNFHSVEYNKISREIKMHIYLSETEVKIYANIAEYIKQCRAKIDKLIETAPEIPHHIEEKLQHKIKLIRCDENNELNEIITLKKLQERQQIQSHDDISIHSTIKTMRHSEPSIIPATHQGDKNIRMSEVFVNSRNNEGTSVNIFINESNDKDLHMKDSSYTSSSSNRVSFELPSLSRQDSSLKQIKYYFSSVDDDES